MLQLQSYAVTGCTRRDERIFMFYYLPGVLSRANGRQVMQTYLSWGVEGRAAHTSRKKVIVNCNLL